MKVLVVGNGNRSTTKLVDYLNLLDGITVCGIAGEFREVLNSGSILEADLVILDTAVVTGEIQNLLDELAAIADIHVVAPDRDRSGASNSLTLDNPIRATTMDDGFISVDGTPTDCVHLAITGLLDEEPGLDCSG